MKKPIEETVNNSKDLLLICSTAVIIAVSTNCICAYIVELCSVKWICLVIGLFLLFVAIWIIRLIFPRHKEYIFRYNGGIAYEISGNTINGFKIAGYEFNDDFIQYLRGFLSENEVFIRYLKDNADILQDAALSFNPSKNTRLTILRSVLECVVLNQLSLHLNEYFVENEMDEAQVLCLKRSDLDANVLRNKVLDAVSRDMEDRNAFADFGPNPENGEVAFAIGSNGVIYDRINFELPPGSCLTRNKDGFLVVSTKRFDIKIIPVVDGFCTNIDPVLIQPDVPPAYCPLRACVKLVVSVKRELFSRCSNADMYAWLDSFTERLAEYISIDSLHTRMNVGLLRVLSKPMDKGSGKAKYSIVKVEKKDANDISNGSK